MVFSDSKSRVSMTGLKFDVFNCVAIGPQGANCQNIHIVVLCSRVLTFSVWLYLTLWKSTMHFFWDHISVYLYIAHPSVCHVMNDKVTGETSGELWLNNLSVKSTDENRDIFRCPLQETSLINWWKLRLVNVGILTGYKSYPTITGVQITHLHSRQTGYQSSGFWLNNFSVKSTDENRDIFRCPHQETSPINRWKLRLNVGILTDYRSYPTIISGVHNLSLSPVILGSAESIMKSRISSLMRIWAEFEIY